MNSLTAYGLGHALSDSLMGTTIKKLMRYEGGFVLETEHAEMPFLHLLCFGREPELVPSRRRYISEAYTTAAPGALTRVRIRGVDPLGIDRILLFTVVGGGGWGNGEESIVRIDMTPASMPITVFRGKDGAPVEWYGPSRAARPATPTAVPLEKPYSLLALPETAPESVSAAAGGSFPEGTPGHTRRWFTVKRAAAVLVKAVGGLDPVLATALSNAFDGVIDAIWHRLRDIGGAALDRRFSWHRYDFPEAGPAGRCAIYPVELPIDAKAIPLANAFEAVALRGDEIVRPAYVQYLRRAALSAARRHLRRSERLAKRLADDLAEARRSHEYRRYGSLLVTNRHLMKRGMREIEVRDFSGDGAVTIPLSPRMTPDENIRRYFARAKKGEKGALIITGRKREIERTVGEQRAFIGRLSRLESPDEIMPFIPKRAGGARPADAESDRIPFRRFIIDERHTIFVGRKDRENDQLTHRFAGPRDLWFHAQGAAGSHVILRGATASTPKRILEQAAAVAAYFSKARNASIVPVIYAEKRYVSKPRGSRHGTAVCRRGKTLYVRPALPEQK